MYNFDYDDFKKELDLTTNIPINRYGLTVKPDSTASVQDPDTGETLEINLNEIPDKYVNLVFVPKNREPIRKYQVGTSRDDKPKEKISSMIYESSNNRIVIVTENIHQFDTGGRFKGAVTGSKQSRYNRTYRSIDVINNNTLYIDLDKNGIDDPPGNDTATGNNMYIQSVDSRDTSIKYLWGENISEDEEEDINTTNVYFGEDNLQEPILEVDGINRQNEVKSYNIPILPRHELMTDKEDPNGIPYSNEENRSFQIDREIFAALGLWPNNDYNITLGKQLDNGDYRNTLGTPDSKAQGYIYIKEFQEKLTALRDILEPQNIAIRIPKYYLEKLVEKENGKFIDINKSFIRANGRFNSRFSHSQLLGMGRKRYKEFIYDPNKPDRKVKIKPETGFINRKTLGLTDTGGKFSKKYKIEEDLSLLPKTSEEVSPFSLSVKEIVKAQLDKDELNTELAEALDYVFETMSEISGKALQKIKDDINGPKPKDIPEGEEDPNAIIKEVELWEVDPITGENTGIPVYQTDPTLVVSEEEAAKSKNLRANPEGYVLLKGKKNPKPENRIQETKLEINLTNENIKISDIAPRLRSAMRKTRRKVSWSWGFSIGRSFSLTRVEIGIRRFENVLDKIMWYERYTNESVFPSREFVTVEDKNYDDEDKNVDLSRLRSFKKADRVMARALIPVNFGVKKKKRKKRSWWRRAIRVVAVVTVATITGGVGGALLARYFWGRKTINMGVRWVRVEFIDTSVLEKYRSNNIPSGDRLTAKVPVTLSRAEIDGQISGITIRAKSGESFDTIFPQLEDKEAVGVTISGVKNGRKYNGTFSAAWGQDNNFYNSIVYVLNGGDEITEVPEGDDIVLSRIITSFEKSKPEATPEQSNIKFNMPNLPSDDAIRKKAFSLFGQFQQEKDSNRVEEPENLPITVRDNLGSVFETNDVPSGYKIFYDSSKRIRDMRMGLDIYNKVRFLLHILRDEFNGHRVKLVETVRSLEDQNKLQLGGPESNFLSWHNFGLSVKILITKKDEVIQRRTPDFFKLLDIAEAFTKGAREGKFGEPMNVIWCEQLVLGANMFVWEFLPMGVGHRSAWKFREAAFNQQDPILAHGYVNVTEKGYVIKDTDPTDDTPYIRKGSSAYQNGIKLNNDVWVHPSNINNFTVPNSLVLKDLQEFLFLIENKFNAHGTDLLDGLKVTQWKQQNPISFDQLMMYNSLLGSFATVRALLAIDYIDKYKILINSLSKADPIEFVRSFLGEDEYENIRITLQNSPDGSFITLHDGKITIPLTETRSTHPAGSGNIFGEREVDENSIEKGYYNDEGIFIPETDETPIPIIKSDDPVIDGYDIDGNPVEGDALFLHILIKSQILKEAERIKALYESLDTRFLYDKLQNSPNAPLKDTLENEFGVISSQTLSDPRLTGIDEELAETKRQILAIDNGFDVMDFDSIKDMYRKLDINSNVDTVGTGDNTNIDIDTNPATNPNADRNTENQSIYEKLVSTAQFSGVQFARLTKEKPVIEELQNDVTVERVMKFIENKETDIPDVKDIL